MSNDKRNTEAELALTLKTMAATASNIENTLKEATLSLEKTLKKSDATLAALNKATDIIALVPQKISESISNNIELVREEIVSTTTEGIVAKLEKVQGAIGPEIENVIANFKKEIEEGTKHHKKTLAAGVTTFLTSLKEKLDILTKDVDIATQKSAGLVESKAKAYFKLYAPILLICMGFSSISTYWVLKQYPKSVVLETKSGVSVSGGNILFNKPENINVHGNDFAKQELIKKDKEQSPTRTKTK